MLVFSCACSDAQRVVLQTVIDDRTTLTLYEGDNPCKVLHEMCCSDEDLDVDEACIDAIYPFIMRQLTAAWRHYSSFLSIDSSLFLKCVDIHHRQLYYNASQSGRNNVDQTMGDLLDILRDGEGDEKAARIFDVRRNDLRMTADEQLKLYLQAVLLEPNHPLIVGQFGVTLLAVGREDLARALFEDAVNRGIWANVMQRPVSYRVPGLTSKPWYDAQEFGFTAVLERAYEDIRKELVDVTEGNDLFYTEAENRNSHNIDGSWKTLLVKDRYSYTDLAKKHFQKTIEWLEKCENDFLLVKFSALDPGTHIRPHTGPSNERLRSHFTLIHSGGARLRVGSEWRTWEEGKVVIFDSSWEHEVVHEGPNRRVVLILDVWHPDYLNHYSDGH